MESWGGDWYAFPPPPRPYVEVVQERLALLTNAELFDELMRTNYDGEYGQSTDGEESEMAVRERLADWLKEAR